MKRIQAGLRKKLRPVLMSGARPLTLESENDFKGGVCGVYVKTIPSKAGYAGYVKNKKILKAGGLKRVIAGYWQHN